MAWARRRVHHGRYQHCGRVVPLRSRLRGPNSVRTGAPIVGGCLGTPATVLAPVLSWVGMRRSEAWRGYRALTLVAGALLAVVAGWLTICHYGDFERTARSAGAVQRLFLGILYLWTEVVAVRLWRLAARERHPTERIAPDCS